MERNETRRLIDAYGADPGRWPQGVRPQDIDPVPLDEARRLDGLLAALAPIPEDPASVERVMTRLERLPAQRRSAWSVHGWSDWWGEFSDVVFWPRVAALATASMLGVMIGLSDLAAPVAADSEPDLAALILDEAPIAGLED